MANLNICVDDTLKRKSELILSELGISLSTAFTMYLEQVVRCNGVPFVLCADPFYSVENQARLFASKERMEQTGGTVHELIEMDLD